MSETTREETALVGTIVFVDADVLLHYPPLSELPWETLCPGTPTIAICLTVIGQVDSKKNDPRLQQRAKRAISDIRRFRDLGYVKEGLPFFVYRDAVRADEVQHPLVPECADDRILTAMLKVRNCNPLSDPRLISGDIVMEIKCQCLGIPFVSLEGVERLAPTADQMTKKVRELERQVAFLQGRIPNLHIEAKCLGHQGLAVDAVDPGLEPPASASWCDEAFEKEVREAIGGLEKLDRMEANDKAEWEGYFGKYRLHIDLMRAKSEILRRTVVCGLYLTNRGTAPATHIRARIEFPTKVRVLEKESEGGRLLCRPLVPPERPVKRSLFYTNTVSQTHDPRTILDAAIFRQRDETVAECSVKQAENKNECDAVVIRLGRLQQGETASCREYCVIYDSPEELTPLQLTGKITASEMPEQAVRQTGFLIDESIERKAKSK